MPTSTRPRARQRPRVGQIALSLPHEVDHVFRPLDQIFAQLRAGEVDAERGTPVFLAGKDHWAAICPALEGWIATWQLIGERFRLGIDQTPLDSLRRKLDAGMPMVPGEVEAAAAVIGAQRVAYARLNAHEVKAISRTAEIKLELESMHG
jgi:hypothetical protein